MNVREIDVLSVNGDLDQQQQPLLCWVFVLMRIQVKLQKHLKSEAGNVNCRVSVWGI